MAKHNYLSNFDCFLCDSTPLLVHWIVITPKNLYNKTRHIKISNTKSWIPKHKKKEKVWRLPLLIHWTYQVDSCWCHTYWSACSTPNSLNMPAMWILNSPTLHNVNTKFTNNEICKAIKCSHIQMQLKESKIIEIRVCLCTMHLKTTMCCAQCWHWIMNTRSKLILNSHIMQSVHTIRCIQRKQISWNPFMSMHYELKDSNELCIMLILRNEHACNINPKLTHNAQWWCQVL